MTLTRDGRCEKHQHRWRNGGVTRTSDPRHRAWRRDVLRRWGNVCYVQLQGRCLIRATDADHVIPVWKGGAEFDVNNGRPICQACHAWKSSMEGHEAQGHNV